MIDGIANYSGNKEVEARCHAATSGIDAAIDDMIPVLDKTSQHLDPQRAARRRPADAKRARQYQARNLRRAERAARCHLRHDLGMLTHPDQLALVREGRAKWLDAFEEYARWIAPIGMSPRRVAKHWSYGGVDFEPEDRVFFMFGSAQSRRNLFADPDIFDITRDTSKSIAFGAGPHYCAGAFASPESPPPWPLCIVALQLGCRGCAIGAASLAAHCGV